MYNLFVIFSTLLAFAACWKKYIYLVLLRKQKKYKFNKSLGNKPSHVYDMHTQANIIDIKLTLYGK